MIIFLNEMHCVKSVRIRSFSGPTYTPFLLFHNSDAAHFTVMEEAKPNTEENYY